jgi:hypothetical protein
MWLDARALSQVADQKQDDQNDYDCVQHGFLLSWFGG